MKELLFTAGSYAIDAGKVAIPSAVAGGALRFAGYKGLDNVSPSNNDGAIFIGFSLLACIMLYEVPTMFMTNLNEANENTLVRSHIMAAIMVTSFLCGVAYSKKCADDALTLQRSARPILPF